MADDKQGERSVQRQVRAVCATCDCWVPDRMQCRAAKGEAAPPESTCPGWIRTRRRDFWFDRYHRIPGPISSCPQPGEPGGDGDDYERWMDELAENCQADQKPCDGCQQGGICDGWRASLEARLDATEAPSERPNKDSATEVT